MIPTPRQAPGGGGSNETAIWFWRHHRSDCLCCVGDIALRDRRVRKESWECTSFHSRNCAYHRQRRSQEAASPTSRLIPTTAPSIPSGISIGDLASIGDSARGDSC